VVCHGESPEAHIFAALADALGVPVTAADAEVSLTRSGRLHTSGRFARGSLARRTSSLAVLS